MNKKTTKTEPEKKEEIEIYGAKLEMTIKDRLIISALFPQKSNLVGQVVAKEISAKCMIEEKEAKEIGLRRTPNGNWTWSNAPIKPKVVDLTAPEVAFLKTQVSRVDEAGEVTADLLDLCQKVQGLS